ncbi:MAG: peptidoglycan D,D-transpeptidase FtsI family protein [Gaiellaceae bacterium]
MRDKRQAARHANRRIRLLLLVFGLMFAALFGRAVWLQAIQASSLERLADTQHRVTVSLPAGRGTIFDRAGVPLAIGTQATTVYADPRRVRNSWEVALAAGRALHLEPDDLYAQLADRRRRFVYVARQSDRAGAETLRAQNLPGLGFYPEERRIYPQNDVGAHVVGYAGVDNRGLAGVERQFDAVLAGASGSETYVREPTGRAVEVVRRVVPREGRDVHLTLDRLIQANAEQALRRTVQKWQAKAATAIVLDPRTGGILAMAAVPRFDANRFDETSPDVSRNRAVTDTYEPGSTFKVVTVAAVLAHRMVTPQTGFTLAPSIEVADRVIKESERDYTKWMTVADIVAESSNVGAVTLAQRLGPDLLSRWIQRFGFGRRTGVDFPGETPGIVPALVGWSGSTIGTLPIGHGIGVTPVQMAAAYGAIASGGVWRRPHLVERIEGEPAVRPEHRRVMPQRVARQLLDMLRGVVTRGSGEAAAVAGYRVAGKTGTAAKPDDRGYSHTRYVASFVGVVPASKPRFVILVAVDEPQGAIWGGKVAAPAFAEIARFDLQYAGVAPDG